MLVHLGLKSLSRSFGDPQRENGGDLLGFCGPLPDMALSGFLFSFWTSPKQQILIGFLGDLHGRFCTSSCDSKLPGNLAEFPNLPGPQLLLLGVRKNPFNNYVDLS